MNFQTVTQANGQNLAMIAEVLEIGNTRQTNKGKNCQSTKLKDSNGEIHAVTIHQGNGQLLAGHHLMTRQQFSLSTYTTQQGGIAYSGFWNDKAQVNQSPQQAQQQVPQQQRYVNTEDAKNTSIERQVAVKASGTICAAIVTSGGAMSPEVAELYAIVYARFMTNGPPVQQVAPRAQDDRDYSDGNPDQTTWPDDVPL